MAVFKQISKSDITVRKSFLNQQIDIAENDISASISRKKYQVFVTGGFGPGVTSSLFQTVFDQDFSMQTANAIFDITMGLLPTGPTVQSASLGTDVVGKELFPSSSLMMREKMDVYRQFAKTLLGDSTLSFVSPFDSVNNTDKIDSALFIPFKRLFARDALKRDTFGMKFFVSGNIASSTNLNTEGFDQRVFTDNGSSVSKTMSFGGAVGNIVESTNTFNTVGLLFYDQGIAVFDMKKICAANQVMSGTIDAMNPFGITTFSGSFIPSFVTNASIDNIIDHVCSTRFSGSNNTAITFQNVTNINSTLVNCRISQDEFNYSSNPSFVDENNRIVVIDPGEEDTQQTFNFITTVSLYDIDNNCIGTAKLSRPVENSPERDLTLTLRLDY